MRIDGDSDEGLLAAVGTARRGYTTTIESNWPVERVGDDLGSDGQIGWLGRGAEGWRRKPAQAYRWPAMGAVQKEQTVWWCWWCWRQTS